MSSEPPGAGAPAVQASYMKNVFGTLRERGHLERVAQRDPGLAAEVEAAARLSWLPVELNVRMVEAVVGAYGDPAGLEILSDCVLAQFDSPLWKNFIGGAVRLLGRDPASLGRWLPKAFQLVFCDCGFWVVEASGDHELTVSVADLPTPLAEHRAWLRSLAIGMKPLFALCGTDGTCDLVSVDAAMGRARYRLAWKPRDRAD